VKSSKPIYGVNTGFGRLAQVRISEGELVDLQVNLLRSHASGIGEQAPGSVVRRLLLLRVLSLSKGYSGVSLPILQRHLEYLHKGLIPYIPLQGSVGASGDLAPLAHLGLTFMGEGEFVENGKRIPSSRVLKKYNWKPLAIHPKEGLSLTNGTQFSLALALEVLTQLQVLVSWVEVAACLSIEAHQATSAVFIPRIHEIKAHPKQLEIAKRFSARLRGSKHMQSHRNCDRVQDAYSFRCIPQVLGPCYSLIDSAKQLLEDEINSVSDNPVVFPVEKKIYSCGHFHAQAVSMASDLMTMAMVTMGNLSERRIDQIVNPLTSRSPAFLATKPGVESGLMIVQTAAAGLASENKTLSFPASADTIPTNGNQEDHVSMAPWAARKSLQVLANLRKIIAAEILSAVRGCVHESTRTGLSFSRFVEQNLSEIADAVPILFRAGDRVFSKDWEQLEAYLKTKAKI